MWGWAWIRIEAPMKSLNISIEKKNNEWKYDIPDVELDSFNMTWYDDWMNDIRWDFLKSDIKLSIDKDTLDNFIEKYKQSIIEDKGLDKNDEIEFVNIDVLYNITLDDMYWSWYIRWKAEDISLFDCDIEFKTAYVNFKINGLDDYVGIDYEDYEIFENKLEACYVKENEENFNNMYNNLFKWPDISSEEIKEYREMNEIEEDVSDDDIIERITENYWDFIYDEYSAK